MAEMTAEKFAQRTFDLDLVDSHKLEAVWSEFGSRDVPLDRFTSLMVRRELLTNFQVERILDGKRVGYFYGNYKVLYLVGSGTFARVYRAANRETGRVRAVKVLRKRYADDLVTTEQFLREARMVMPLRHPNIVPVYEVEEDRGRTFMVMEFVEGQNLRDFLKRRKQLDVPASLKLLADILAGLDYAANKGVTHRDMKLSNVLIASTGRAKLVDFGLAAITAKMTDEAISAAPNPRSIDYAGLERITGVRKNDERSDLYFTGVMLYHMLAGQSPLYETRDRIKRLSVRRYREIKPLVQLVPDLPNYLVAVVNKSMDLRPEKRYQNPGEMLNDVRKVMQRVESGDKGVYVSERGASESTESEHVDGDQTPLEREGEDRTVLIVESNVQMQDSFRMALKKRGYRVLMVSDPERALRRFAEHDEPEPLAHCVVFSAGDLGSSAVDAFNAFGQADETKDIAAILLVNRDNQEHVQRAQTNDHRALLPLSLKIRHLRLQLLKLLKQTEASQSS